MKKIFGLYMFIIIAIFLLSCEQNSKSVCKKTEEKKCMDTLKKVPIGVLNKDKKGDDFNMGIGITSGRVGIDMGSGFVITSEGIEPGFGF
jgi:uncharacterized membrane protein YfcA